MMDMDITRRTFFNYRLLLMAVLLTIIFSLVPSIFFWIRLYYAFFISLWLASDLMKFSTYLGVINIVDAKDSFFDGNVVAWIYRLSGFQATYFFLLDKSLDN